MPEERSVQQANQALADSINQEALRNPQSPYAGKFVGIVGGKVVADTLNDVMNSLEQLPGGLKDKFVIEAGLDYGKVIEIWSPPNCVQVKE